MLHYVHQLVANLVSELSERFVRKQLSAAAGNNAGENDKTKADRKIVRHEIKTMSAKTLNK